MKTSTSPLWTGALAALMCASLCACAGSTPPPKTESDWSSSTDDASSGLDSEASDRDELHAEGDGDGDGESTEAAPPKKKQPDNEDYDITHRDCDALAQAYHNAWLGDELPKLTAKKLKEKQHQAAEAQLREAASEASGQWYGQCEGIVGTAFLRGRLVCAMKAKSLQRFNDCWDGKVE